jgi:hypothetical protein
MGLVWLQHRLAGVADTVGEFAEQYPLSLIWRCAHAWALCEEGRDDEARAVVREHALDPRDFVADPMPFIGIQQLSFVAFALRDRDLAAKIVEALTPHRERWAHYYMMILDPAVVGLGLARVVVGEVDGGIEDIDEGIEQLTAHGLVAHLPTNRLFLAAVLDERGTSEDRKRAAAERVTARAEAEALGLVDVVAHIDSLTA